jgi:ketosteroid isomerase-like protein
MKPHVSVDACVADLTVARARNFNRVRLPQDAVLWQSLVRYANEKGRLLAMAGVMLLAACGSPPPAMPPPVSNATLQEQVMTTERAFAATMARRDREAFAGFLDPETIFYSGRDVLRGRDQVAAAWNAYFEGGEAPFSWEPDSVQVLDSGTLALSTGPCHRALQFDLAAKRDWRLEDHL